MTQEEAFEAARLECSRRGWPWTPEVIVNKARRFCFVGPWYWLVVTNYPNKGGNVRITIDDLTGNVMRASFSRR
jgi:hypothetical protein